MLSILSGLSIATFGTIVVPSLNPTTLTISGSTSASCKNSLKDDALLHGDNEMIFKLLATAASYWNVRSNSNNNPYSRFGIHPAIQDN